METISGQQLDKLRKLVGQIAKLLESVSGEKVRISPEIAAMVAAKLAKNICLQCDPPVSHESLQRGLCGPHRATTYADIKSGKESEKDLISRGLITAEKAKPGRKRKPSLLDKATAEKPGGYTLAEKPESLPPLPTKKKKKTR